MRGPRQCLGVEQTLLDFRLIRLPRLDQVLEDQLTPAISARLDQQSALRKPSKFDRRETEIFGKLTNLLCSTVIVARQEHDSLATVYGRILVKDGSDQMVEALDQSCAGKSLRDDLG